MLRINHDPRAPIGDDKAHKPASLLRPQLSETGCTGALRWRNAQRAKPGRSSHGSCPATERTRVYLPDASVLGLDQPAVATSTEPAYLGHGRGRRSDNPASECEN